MLVKQDCQFCAELHHIENSGAVMCEFILSTLKVDSRVLYETENFVVVPTVGSFIEGYVLVVSKYHYISARSLSKELRVELRKLLRLICDFNSRQYGNTSLIFEHVGVMSGNEGSCIDHMHMHVLPAGMSVINRLKMDNFKLQEIVDDTAFSLTPHINSYIYYEDVDQRKFICSSDAIPSQIMRRFIAESLGIYGKWDWSEFFFADKMSKTIKTYKKYFAVDDVSTFRNCSVL